MGLIGNLLGALFGTGRNAIAETVEVFRPNAEAAERREAERANAALAQFAAEFAVNRRSAFDTLMDGVNRLPRPMLAFGTIGLMTSALVDPVWFAARMQGIALVPEPLWWLMGAIVSFYFGARHQFKAQAYEDAMARTMAAAPQVVANVEALEAMRAQKAGRAPEASSVATPPAAVDAGAPLSRPKAPKGPMPTDILPNRALDDWRASHGQ